MSNLSPKVQDVLKKALTKLEDYQTGVRAACTIHEMLPSQAQRNAHLRLSNRRMHDAYKEAEKESILGFICSKSVILYGRSSINYVYTVENKGTRTETLLHAHEYSVDIPALQYIDPHGLDYMIRIFRYERNE